MSTPQEVDRRTALIEALDVLGAGPEERFDRITRMTHDAFGVPLTFLNLVHHDLVTTQSTFGWNQGTSVPANEQFCATTVLTPEPLVIPDTTLDPRFAHTAAVAEHGIRFYAGAPLSMLDGTRVGTLCIMDAQPRAFSATDLALLRDLARWAERELGYALERDRLTRVRAALVPDPLSVPGHDVATLAVQRPDGGGGLTDWRVAPRRRPAPDGRRGGRRTRLVAPRGRRPRGTGRADRPPDRRGGRRTGGPGHPRPPGRRRGRRAGARTARPDDGARRPGGRRARHRGGRQRRRQRPSGAVHRAARRARYRVDPPEPGRRCRSSWQPATGSCWPPTRGRPCPASRGPKRSRPSSPHSPTARRRSSTSVRCCPGATRRPT
ncbi:GAF domain-containing protein [Curtobacterium sp. MCPF17_052]|nr:GAF domain-containing protein [Curtobacterium sp. MCPF17_052]WIB13812.1 GAF domain-containing protein [Curtobacterium sp. MCPF17_052]